MQNPSKKPRYNLSLVVQETGLTPDTLRAWEKRYNLPHPERSRGGHRLYSDYDLAVIKWLQSRLDQGMRISQAVEYWQDLAGAGHDPLLEHPLGQPQTAPAGQDLSGQALTALRQAWVERACSYDEQGAEQVLNQAFAQFPLEVVCADLLSPALAEIGSSWYAGSTTPQQEHFASELAARKIQALIASAPLPLDERKILLACPPGELHVIPLLMINLLLRYRGWDVLYLGANVPVEQLIDTIQRTRPELAVLSASRLASAAALLRVVRLLAEHRVASAFGGWVFQRNPLLAQLIPAHYLGPNLLEGVAAIEGLLQQPALIPDREPQSDLAALRSYQERLSLLESRVLEILNGDLADPLAADVIRQANQQLAAAGSAALELGAVSLLGEELGWLQGLLAKRGLAEDRYQRYLAAYAQAAGEVFKDQDHPLPGWLESWINKPDPEEG